MLTCLSLSLMERIELNRRDAPQLTLSSVPNHHALEQEACA